MTEVEMVRIRQIVGQLMRQTCDNMPESLYKQGYETALKDVLAVYDEQEKQLQWRK